MLDRLRYRRGVIARRAWADLADTVPDMDGARRRALADEARHLRADLDRFLMAAGWRTGGARLDSLGLPPGTDWAWRPSLFEAVLPGRGMVNPNGGTALGPDAVIWHDLPDAPLMVSQHANRLTDDLPPFGLGIESFAPGEAGYIALSFNLPPEALEDLDTSFVLQVDTVTGAECPATIYLRLNIEHGPDTEKLLRHLVGADRGEAVRMTSGFDLGFVQMVPRRLAKIWLDVIVEKPAFNAVFLRDLVISRHHRADM